MKSSSWHVTEQFHKEVLYCPLIQNAKMLKARAERAVHVFLADSHSTKFGESGTDIPPKVTSGTDAQTDGATV
ncbi:hypothetical protein H5410_061169 [Solanum commersonii]|uniref:Uncharacterized protein n=1 Tax=Solanum commersonii TaxID=4109 RepID=A0A9J5W6Y8_SOLCO|nr:hypothetical protein H5410_061169 [Solanum commersonii]